MLVFSQKVFSYYISKLLQKRFLLRQRKSEIEKMNKEFPQYRKLSNEKSFYIIHANDRMTEFMRLGNQWQRHELTARILPERNLIADLLSGFGGTYCVIAEEEFFAKVNITDPI